MQPIPLEKLHALQSEIIKRQERKINELRTSNRILEATNQTLAEALDRVLNREGSDRVFVPIREIGSAQFHVEETIDGDLLIVRCGR